VGLLAHDSEPGPGRANFSLAFFRHSRSGCALRRKQKHKRSIKMKALVTSVVILCAAGLTGCSTFNSRAQQKAAVYNTLAPQTQQRLEKGKISIGDTQDMVFIALDTPDAKRDITTANGAESVWIYKTYWEDYAGTGWVGWHRYYEPRMDGAFSIFHERVPLALTRTRVADVIRITFKDGKVISVDQSAAA
jgi:hypothetical protein